MSKGPRTLAASAWTALSTLAVGDSSPERGGPTCASRDEATTVSATLLAAELTVGQVTQVFHAGVPVGYVISQTPAHSGPLVGDEATTVSPLRTPVGPRSAVAYVPP